MIEIIHTTAQYLASAAISFIPKKEDDSHTNLKWTNHTLETHPFLNGDKLGLNYEHFSLEWIHHNGNKEHLFLNNLTHKDIIEWIAQVSANNGIESTYSYNIHYELPYKKVSDTTRFKITNQDELNRLMRNRDLAQHVISSVLKSHNYESSIRIWPHHFDTGALVTINSRFSIGLGMSIPDSLIDDFYFYISGYSGHNPVDIDLLNSINKESYYNNGWQGFAKPVSELNEHSAIDFFQAAINTYLNTVK